MAHAVQVFLTIVPCTYAEWLASFYLDGILLISDIKETYIATVTIILWMDVVCLKLT